MPLPRWTPRGAGPERADSLSAAPPTRRPGTSRTSASARCERFEASHLQRERHAASHVARQRVGRRDVDALAREHFGDVAQQSLPVGRFEHDVDRKHLVARRAPVGGDKALGLARAKPRDGRAARAVDRHALAARDEADDAVGRRRLAAAREHRHQPVDAERRGCRCPPPPPCSARRSPGSASFGRSVRASGCTTRLDRSLDLPRVELLAPDRGEEIVGLLEARLFRDRVEIDRRRAGARELALDRPRGRARAFPRAAAP